MGSTYFDGGNSEIQSSAQGNLQTLYLMNPTYVPYSHLDALNLSTLSHAPPPHLLALTIPQQQGLSLSLSPHQQMTAANHYNRSLSGGDDDEMQIAGGGNSSTLILGSKYVQAAQELLDEVVNVGISLQTEGKQTSNYNKHKIMKPNNTTSQSPQSDRPNIIHASSCKQPPPQPDELTTAQRQDLHMNKSKLLTMLDQVEQRYRQYREEMQIVISSFEEAAGYGGAKSYTALALKTISKQFRCLKDAIAWEIKATSKRLGTEDQDCLAGIGSGNRLRYVDHHVRQHRALQQLGMMQHNAWRPQRGLPERAVSILRAWLFEHFLHPYPKDSDKVMLAKQTGLTRSQVSNWFINARVRLWKPMVEEMYLEETKDEQQDEEKNAISKDETSKMVEANNNSNAGPNMMMIRSFDDQMKSSADHTTFNINQASSSLSDVISSSSNSGMGMDNNVMEIKPPHNINMKDGFKYLSGGYAAAAAAGIGFSSIQGINGRFSVNNNVVSEQHHHLAPRFHGNGVSLTLGLPHNTDNINNNNNNLSHHHHHAFLSHLATNNNINASSDSDLCAITTPPPSHNSATFPNLDIHNRTKSFPTQLLPDFVT